MNTPQGPIRPGRSRFFTGRSQVPSSGVNQDTVLLGHKDDGEVPAQGLMRAIGRLAFIIRHPKIYLKQRAEDQSRREQEEALGEFQDTRNITDRKISVEPEHLQTVTKTIQSKLAKEGLGYDPLDDKTDELEHVQKLRAGNWEGKIPGIRNPKSSAAKQKLDRLKAEYELDKATMQARNKEMSDRFAEFDNVSEEMRELSKSYEDVRQLHNEACDYLEQLDEMHDYPRATDRIVTDAGVKTREQLDEERINLREQALLVKDQIQNWRLQQVSKSDSQRESPKVMDDVHRDMETFMETSQKEYDEMWALLQRFPSLVHGLGGKDAAAKIAKGDQLKQFRVDVIGGLEQKFVAAKGDEKQEKELGRAIYAKRLMAMRMDEMIRATDSPEALHEKVEEYTGKKLEPQSSPSKFAVDDGWSAEDWENSWNDEGWEDDWKDAKSEWVNGDKPSLPLSNELPAYINILNHQQTQIDQDIDKLIVPPPPDFNANQEDK